MLNSLWWSSSVLPLLPVIYECCLLGVGAVKSLLGMTSQVRMTRCWVLTLSEMVPVEKGDYHFVLGANCNLPERGAGDTQLAHVPVGRLQTGTVECPLRWNTEHYNITTLHEIFLKWPFALNSADNFSILNQYSNHFVPNWLLST